MAGFPRTIEPGAKLRAHSEKNAAIQWPLPIDHRLEMLVEAATEAGENTSRKELAAAIMFNAPTDGEELAAILRQYRTATAGDALPWFASEEVVELPRHKPGPRPRRSS